MDSSTSIGRINLTQILSLANGGEAESQFQLGQMYYSGSEVTEDPSAAYQWILKAAERNHPRAQVLLASFYEKGIGINIDERQSLEWLQKAALRGEREAQFRLGLRLKEGETVEKNLEAGVRWITKAAEQGHSPAQAELATMYILGDGIEENHGKAFRWYTKAAAANNGGGIYGLGLMYDGGYHVPQDKGKALEYFEKAANLGHLPAYLNSAVMLFLGEGAPQDMNLAEERLQQYLSRGKSSGQSDIKWFLTQVCTRLSEKIPQGSNLYAYPDIPGMKKKAAAETFLKPLLERKDPVLLLYDHPAGRSGESGFALGERRLAWKASDATARCEPFAWEGFSRMELAGSEMILPGEPPIPFPLPAREQHLIFHLLSLLHRHSPQIE
jgi:TPR repeat protein